jgi:hypothetical protein
VLYNFIELKLNTAAMEGLKGGKVESVYGNLSIKTAGL